MLGAVAGSCATAARESSQGRKAAALQRVWPGAVANLAAAPNFGARQTIGGSDSPDRRHPPGAAEPVTGSVRAGSHRQNPWIGSPIMADTHFVSLYRRFRPGRFDEIRGQDHVVRALRSAGSATTGCRTPTSSADPGAPARPRRRGSSPRRSIARRPSMVSRAASAPRAWRSPRGVRSTCTSSMPPRTTASTRSATWWRTPAWAPRGAGRSTSSTRSTCSPPRRRTHC